MKDGISLKGELTITVYNETGVCDIRKYNNLVVKTGKDFVASRMGGDLTPLISKMAVGTQNTAPTVNDTSLGTEIANVTLDSTVVNSNVITYTGTFAPGIGTGTLFEAGLFNDAGNMLSHATINSFEKTANLAIVIAWDIHII